MKRIAIIGGGISGLSAAFALEQRRRQGAPLEYVLFESTPRFGGVIQTDRIEDCVIEAGPDSFLTEKPWAADLCGELGLGDQLIGSNDRERKTYILVKGRLVPLPDGLMLMVPTKPLSAFSSPLFSWSAKLRMLREWFYRYTPSSSESTVAEFVTRHYGREMVDRVADPLLAGVYGGSADELSVAAVLPRFVEMEAQHGSLTRGMLASRTKRHGSVSPPLFTSLKNGMQQLVDALLAQIPKSVRRLNAPIEAVKPEFRKWLAMHSGRTEEFDAMVMAIPAYETARLIGGAAPQLASDLRAIAYSSSVIAIFGYDDKVRAALPPGFGFLVPQKENRRMVAATFVHNKFAHRAPEDRAIVRCFLGGARDEGALQLPDDEIQLTVRQELNELVGITVEPLFIRIYRWKSAMAQYGVGHVARVARIRALAAAMPGLALAGNAYSGIGIPDCVRSGREAATKAMADLSID